jgi:hypothetical protein
MRKALIVGIDNYPSCPLSGCVNDATEMKSVLERNSDGSPNFSVKLMTSNDLTITRSNLKQEIESLFDGDPDIALLFFAGHGTVSSYGGHIVTTDFKKYDEGVSMDDILNLANKSKAKSRIIILDCCYSGSMGSPNLTDGKYAELADGVTVLTACRSTETSSEQNGQGVFTSLLLDALQGGCSDLTGNISPGGVYAYVDRALGPWAQRPVFKTNVSRFVSLRSVAPPIETAILRNITKHFASAYDDFKLDPSFEDTEADAKAENVKVFKELQKMEGVGLVKPVGEEHMYYAALNRKSCKLTALGMQYWNLVTSGNI